MLRELIDGMVSLVMAWDEGEPPLQDRREKVRLHCHYPVKVTAGKNTFRSVVTDVGPKGMRLKFVAPLRKGSRLSVTYDYDPQSSPVECRTVWCRKRRFSDDRVAGVEFLHPEEPESDSWVGVILGELGFDAAIEHNPRRWVRADTHFPARLGWGAHQREAKIFNLGVGGALLMAEQLDLEKGLEVTLELGPWDDLSALVLPGTVLNVCHDELVEGSLLRLRFDHGDPDRVDRLGRYVLKILRDKHL